MLNCAVIMGRLTADPELRQTPSGVSVVRFTVAVDRGYVKQGEERQTDFINVVAWRGSADFVAKYFHKGSMIAVQGSIQTGSYEKDGVKHYTLEIVADNVSFCGGKSDVQNSNSSQIAPQSQKTTDNVTTLVDNDDDLPF